MNWNTLFGTEQNISTEETQRLMNSDQFSNYQLLDVRQPQEYQQSHIPGAILIPLSDLNTHLSSLDQGKPVIVYCRSGVRSKSACQILRQSGFDECFNMVGGILKYNGSQAIGDTEFGLEYFTNGEFESSFVLAYQMESNLKQFYLLLSEQADTAASKEMLMQMAMLEDGHMAKLQQKYAPSRDLDGHVGDIAEGGIDLYDMRTALAGQLNSSESVLELAMKLEAQAFDLYSRLARHTSFSNDASFFKEMAQEEQIHLQRLSKQLDNLLEN